MIDQAAQAAGGRASLAKQLEVSVAAIGNWKSRGIPIEYCASIEMASGGMVTRRELRPHDWEKIWPELATAPANTAQAATNCVAIKGA